MYAELHALTNFSFLRGASQPEEMVLRAAELGYRALAITDECSLAGVVRAHMAAKQACLPLIIDVYKRQDMREPRCGCRRVRSWSASAASRVLRWR